MKIYTGTFAVPAGTTANKIIEMRPGDYPVLAWSWPLLIEGQNQDAPDPWTHVVPYNMHWDNAAGSADVTVNWMLLVDTSPIEETLAYGGS